MAAADQSLADRKLNLIQLLLLTNDDEVILQIEKVFQVEKIHKEST